MNFPSSENLLESLSRRMWQERYTEVRGFTESLCETLEPEDCVVQSMPDVSPTRWHLAHTTWFFETFVLRRFAPNYQPYDGAYEVLFNSYYNTVGPQFPRDRRGVLSRPTVRQVWEYRHAIDQQMLVLLERASSDDYESIARIVEIGLHHEQQHQELMLTDIKHVLSCNPLFPVFRQPAVDNGRPPKKAKAQGYGTLAWRAYDAGMTWIGHDEEDEGFAFDNELPRHQTYLHGYELADRLVTNGEYQKFIDDGGYRRPELWLSLGWSQVQTDGWQAPLYWVGDEGGWKQFALGGLLPLDPAEPVCHVSYFEADAYARWAGARLPREADWERAAAACDPEQGNFVECGLLQPRSAGAPASSRVPRQMFGDVWEWTASAYDAYPGYRPAPGALGEYNGKFMCNQYVLRGGSCATSAQHIRPTYRNFFPPEARWQFSGVRLARDLPS